MTAGIRGHRSLLIEIASADIVPGFGAWEGDVVHQQWRQVGAERGLSDGS
jgi:hypothetical protein